jgi:L-lactate dehydrogenase complex protein LldG
VSAGRAAILSAVRRSLRRGEADEAARSAVDARLRTPARGPVPARAQLAHDAQVDLFETMAREHTATLARVGAADDVPAAIAEYLKAGNLPPRLRLAPDTALEALPWDRQPLLEVARGRAEAGDEVSVSGAFAAVAETGTLMLTSGAGSPTTLNFLPDTHIVVLRASQIVGPYEDAWERVRAAYGKGALPRTVNFITGPSRTADIEQTIQLGAHGPRRLHIVLVEDTHADGA